MQHVHSVKSKGFSLIELLIIVAIIGLVIGLGVVKYSTRIKNSRVLNLRNQLLEIHINTQACLSQFKFTNCSNLDQLSLNISRDKYTVDVISTSNKVCYQLTNKRTEVGCYFNNQTRAYKISTKEEIKDSLKGKCNSSADCI